MTDRRRINGPPSGTQPAIFENTAKVLSKPHRSRKPNELRKIFLQTGLVPGAAGSAYLELEVPSSTRSFIPTTSTIKLSCAIQGPKPLPRNASFSPNLQVTASIKFAPFASRQRRGYLRDSAERDLGTHLENALKGTIIADRYPKSSLEVAVMVLEGEEDCLWNEEQGQEHGLNGVGLMNVLAGSINVAVAALIDANIECLDVMSSGVAARAGDDQVDLLDPCPSEHESISAACVVGYLPTRDEIVDIWSKTAASGNIEHSIDGLVDAAVKSSRGAHKILVEVIQESVANQAASTQAREKQQATNDVEMKT